MLDLTKLGILGVLGIVFGMLLVDWVHPTTSGGKVFIFVLSFLATIAVGQGVKSLYDHFVRKSGPQ